MIRVENIETWGFEHVVRGMRNPLNSWDKSDSMIGEIEGYKVEYCIGSNDLALMRRLYKAGPEHRKFMRQIFVSMDIIAPLYLYKEMDQYKIGVTTDSCSTMHTIHKKEFELDDFSHEHLSKSSLYVLNFVIDQMNGCRRVFINSNDKDAWWQMIQLLPSSYNQKRTLTMNYENAVNMIHQRENHRLDEWRNFTDILMELPYMQEIIHEA